MKHNWTIEEYKEALKLAGALAQACENLQKSDWRTLKNRMEVMSDYLTEYNNYIMERV